MMPALDLEQEIDDFVARLASDPGCDPVAMLDAIRRDYLANGLPNLLSSRAASRLYALAGLELAHRGSPDALPLIRTAIALAPYEAGYVRLYEDSLRARRSLSAKPVILVISCEKYAARGLRLAERLECLTQTDHRIVVGREAAFPDHPRLLRVDAPDTYEGLPAKVAAAFGHVFETYESGATALKLDDDVPLVDAQRLEAALERMGRRGVQYSGRPLPGPDLDRIWHWGKCASPEMNARIHGGRHAGQFASGPAYYLGAGALRAFALSAIRFPDLLASAIYEDRYVADVLALGREVLTPARFEDWGLALPTDVEEPNLDGRLWKRLDEAWGQRAADSLAGR